MSSADILTKSITIQNRRGLHARASAKFVKSLEGIKADVKVKKGNSEVSGRSIMGLMMLAAAQGSEISISTFGEDAEQALDILTNLVERKFDEE